ncbi:hypothetical protein EJB05_21753, partial [Eragrostis curvula]
MSPLPVRVALSGALAAQAGAASGRGPAPWSSTAVASGGKLAVAHGGKLELVAVAGGLDGRAKRASRLNAAAGAGGGPEEEFELGYTWISLPPQEAWMESNDDSKVTPVQVLSWSTSALLKLLEDVPPTPLPAGAEPVDKLTEELRVLQARAEANNVEDKEGVWEFIKLFFKVSRIYGFVRVPFKDTDSFKVMAAMSKQACHEHVVRKELRDSLGIRLVNMPESELDHDLVALMMHSVNQTRLHVEAYINVTKGKMKLLGVEWKAPPPDAAGTGDGAKPEDKGKAEYDEDSRKE